jgi:hypothetical protein
LGTAFPKPRAQVRFLPEALTCTGADSIRQNQPDESPMV